jgi:hypothetical protein
MKRENIFKFSSFILIYRANKTTNLNTRNQLKMASTEVDILSIHETVMKNFEEERGKLETYKERLIATEQVLALNLQFSIRKNLEQEQSIVKKRISEIESRKTEDFYVMETAEILVNYTKILRKPKKVSFMGVVEAQEDEKLPLIQNYLRIAQNFIPNINVSCTASVGESKKTCSKCESSRLLETDGFMVCVTCGDEIMMKASSSSYKDAERVNVGSKYTYDKRIHFRDCMNQYQGKQNSTIPQRVYDDLIHEFDQHGLLIKSSDKIERFSKITKEHILLFLKETKHAKHYEDAVLIHYNLTSIKPPDISHLEQEILSDFDQLVETYEKTYKNRKASAVMGAARKNFINNQYVLYQLLTKHSHPCDISEFNILKTVERKTYHDEICRELFSTLGWNFVSVF